MSTDPDIEPQSIPVYDAIDLGRAIRALRSERGWNQAELAAWLGVHRVTVAKLERGGAVDLPLAIRALAILGAMVTVHRRGQGLDLNSTRD